jgi:hypothetical protein
MPMDIIVQGRSTNFFPSRAAVVDDALIGCADAVREPVSRPGELRRAGRERDDGDVIGPLEARRSYANS